jgi:hypothetical protein
MIPIAEFAHSPAFAWSTAELERSGSGMIRARSSCRRKREDPTPGDQAVRAPDGTVRAVRSESDTLPRLAVVSCDNAASLPIEARLGERSGPSVLPAHQTLMDSHRLPCTHMNGTKTETEGFAAANHVERPHPPIWAAAPGLGSALLLRPNWMFWTQMRRRLGLRVRTRPCADGLLRRPPSGAVRLATPAARSVAWPEPGWPDSVRETTIPSGQGRSAQAR